MSGIFLCTETSVGLTGKVIWTEDLLEDCVAVCVVDFGKDSGRTLHTGSGTGTNNPSGSSSRRWLCLYK